MNTLASYAEKAIDDLGDRSWFASSAEDLHLPTHYPRRTLDTLDTGDPRVETAVKAARSWAGRKRDGYADASLVLSGPYGVGKTHIALAILWSIVDVPEENADLAVPAGKIFLANDLLQRLAPSQDPQTGMVITPRAGSLLGTAPLVVIDDVGGQQVLAYIGKEQQDKEFHARWFSFINHCYTLGTSVIITSNLSLAGGHKSQLARHLGGRAWDRLCEMAPAGYMISLDGVKSWRVKAGGR